MDNKHENEELINLPKDVYLEAYRDLAKPTTSVIGSLLSLPFKAIDAALTPLKIWIDNKNYDYKRTQLLLAEKLKNIEPDKISTPEPYVGVPALKQLEYNYNIEELRELYANLLASAMNEDKKWNVHPSFVEIIKQLSPIDARLLQILQTKGVFTVICVKIRYLSNNSFSESLVDYCIDLTSLFDNPELEASCLQNLKRLGIINIRYDQIVKPDSEYDVYNNNDYVKKCYEVEKSNPDLKVELVKGLIEITNFGNKFCEICC